MNPHIFRAYDIRGIYGKDFIASDTELIGKAFASLIKPKKVVIGADNRISSPPIKDSVIKGLVESGCDVIDIGMVPTPLLYYSIIKLKADGGIMITASHLTSEWNGLKICRADSLPLMEDDIQQIHKIAESGKFISGKGSLSSKNMEDQYVEEICGKIKIGRKLRVSVDTGNGMGGPIIKMIFKKLRIEADFLFSEPDGKYPNHHPDPTIEESLKELKKYIKKGKCDFGIAIDGDCDRVVFLNEKAELLKSDQSLALFARDVLKIHKRARIMCEVKCSRLLPEDVEAHGGCVVMGRTGHSFIKNRMHDEREIEIAGEVAAHFFFREFYSIDDAFFASVKMAQIVSSSTNKISETVGTLPKYFSTPEIRLETTEEKKLAVVERMKKDFSEMAKNVKNKITKIVDIDGIRVEFADGWGIARASNTSPVLNLRFEAKTKKRLEEIEKLFMDKVHRYL